MMKEWGDFQLLEAIKKGDKSAFDEIFNRYYQKIHAFAVTQLKSVDEANELVQIVFVKLWMQRDRLKESTKFDGLLFFIAKNEIISYFRKKTTERKFFDNLSAQATTSVNQPDEYLTYEEVKRIYDSTLDKLPTKRKEIFLMHREEGLSYREIAEKKGISIRTVEDHMRMSLRVFRDEFNHWGYAGMLLLWWVI